MLSLSTFHLEAERVYKTCYSFILVLLRLCGWDASGKYDQVPVLSRGPKKQLIYLPDTIESWPWSRSINQYYEEVKAESTAWVRKFHAFDERSQRKFDACDFSLLACLAYPKLTKEQIRTGCDLMMVFFLFDEYSDIADGEQAQRQADAIIDGLKNPEKPRPEGEVILGEATRQFWKLGLETASPRAAERFVDAFELYVHSVVDQAKDRDDNRVRSIHDYFNLRRLTIGARPSFAILELPLDIPEEIWKNDVLEKIVVATIDILILDNDLVSYNVEQARGDDTHNIIRVVMEEKNTDLEGAIKWAKEYHDECKHIFLSNYENLPSWGDEIDENVREYVRGLGNWVIASVCWGFESARYFGNKGNEISKHRVIELLPKEN